MSYDKASPNNKLMFTHVDFSWAMYRFLISHVEFRHSTRKFWRVKTTHERFFLRVKTGHFRIFMCQNQGLQVKREPCYMPNLVALGLMASDKKIFKDFGFFQFCCYGNQSFWRIQILSRNSEEDYGRNISVKFHQNPISSFREDV